ncbi:Zinc transporter ZIP13 [Hondaea fermentalgiana]|uniref:Zinc transporter ZIP13 n=1 Tax=Hondaea fermentalgiana TaxID=2315210 RepID=A0A2R5GKR1_9STRA|nr:Zinc transporter ZIP13 [Hondaea fermentalgiana]|eukprot:GBG31492.1 Zinc transporter ZIP13 [Hondaea fermentalgiana]
MNPKLFNMSKFRLDAFGIKNNSIDAERNDRIESEPELELELELSLTDYKTFLGTNCNPSEVIVSELRSLGTRMANDERAFMADPLGSTRVNNNNIRTRMVIMMRMMKGTVMVMVMGMDMGIIMGMDMDTDMDTMIRGKNRHGDDAHGHEEHGHEHDLTVGLAVLAGILCFFVVEKLLRVAGGSGSHGHAHHSHDDLVARKKKDDDADFGAENATSVGAAAAAPGPPLILGLRPGAILNMVADTVHNFTDGMALAAAFQASDAIGLTMTIAVLVHEVPHEVGDFSVLVSQGLSKWGALRAQFVSALGALAGCGFGLAVSSSQPAAILSFTAGGFIYIALVSIVPELLEEPATVSNTILQTLAACCGIYMMIVIADLEAASHAH